MSTNFFAPTHPRLQSCVEYFWLLRGTGDPANKPLVTPENRFEVILSFADPTIWDAQSEQLALGGSFLCGMRKRPSSLLEHTLSTIHTTQGQITVQQICDHFDIYPKRLEREFKKHIGITPKFYSRIVRFNHALTAIHQHTHMHWIDLVYELGYFDQAHFIKEFAYFLGQTPQTYQSSLTQK
jgi:AraC-like DNA-binding protein